MGPRDGDCRISCPPQVPLHEQDGNAAEALLQGGLGKADVIGADLVAADRRRVATIGKGQGQGLAGAVGELQDDDLRVVPAVGVDLPGVVASMSVRGG